MKPESVSNIEQVIETSSSLDRFLWDNWFKFASGGNRRMTTGLTIASVSNFAISLIFFGTAFATGQQEFLIPATIEFLMAVGFGAWVFSLYRKNSEVGSEFQLTSDASKMISQMTNHIGFRNADSIQDRSQRLQMKQWGAMFENAWWNRARSTRQVLLPEVFELLEPAAFQFNRVAGLVELLKSTSKKNTRLESNAKIAAEETMIRILNQSALIERKPESATVIASQITNDVALLSELGDHLQELSDRSSFVVDHFSPPTALESVLEEMRMEALARQEIRLNTQSEETQINLD